MRASIEQFVKDNIRPYLKQHNGDLEVVAIEDGIVKIKLYGACSGCPQSDLSTKDFIEDQLREAFSEVKKVTIIHDINPELIAFAKELLSRKEHKGL